MGQPHSLHVRAVELSRQHRILEAELVDILRAIDRRKLFKQLGYSSLFLYASDGLGLSESVAYALITVARKSAEIEALKVAIARGSLSVGKASRVCSVLTTDNAESMIAFAEEHSLREIDREVARLRPQAAAPDRISPLATDLHKLQGSINDDVRDMLERIQDLLAGKAGDLNGLLRIVCTEWLERHDPVRKARRAPEPKEHELCAHRVGEPMRAGQRHAVHRRDDGRCTFVDQRGQRCSNQRFTQIHHLRPVSQGGTNEPENLTTLCSYHHALIHELKIPFNGTINWFHEMSQRSD